MLAPAAGGIFDTHLANGYAVADAGRLCPSCQTPIPGDARVCPSCGAISLPGRRGTLGEAVADRLRAALGNRYRVEREVGEGGMAVVFLAHDLRHDRPVALKVLRPELSAFLGAERFLREIHIAAQLNHPHILTLHDSGDADGLLFYVMPYVEGESLRQRLGRLGPLAVTEAVTIAAEVADGLAYAHELGVVHRDIKPENILLAHGHAAIADFGIARALAGAGAGTAITTTGMSPGTPIYMSPEQAAGDHTLDHRADIYSLGCVLYEMLTGHPPYAGPTPQALLVQYAMDPVPSARAARAEVPESLDAAARRAMAKTPGDRFQTAGEFRAALGRPSAVGVRAEPARAWRRRWPWAAGVVLLAAGATLLLRPSRPAAVKAPRPALRVVVRPFEDRTGHRQATADLITEALTGRLQPIPALEVVASSAVSERRGAPLDSLRARFKPDWFVTGRMEETPAGLKVTAQIMDAHTYKGMPDSSVVVPQTADVADAVAERLSGFVRHAFWNQLEQEERHARVHDPEAWTLVVSAADREDDARKAIELNLDGQGFRSLDQADSLLRMARARDRTSDLIPVDLAASAERRAFYVEYLGQALSNLPPNLPSPAETRSAALSLLDSVIRRHAGPADALELRGQIKEGLYRTLGADSLLSGAIADFRAATEHDRRRASAWIQLGSAYGSAGQYADALWAIQHAFEEDAFQLHTKELLRARFDAALRAERYDLATEACHSGFTAAPGNVLFRDCELELWSRTGVDRAVARVAQARVDSLARRESFALFGQLRQLWLAEILARTGLSDSADHVARRATGQLPQPWQPSLLIETAYLRLLRHDADSALALIAVAVRRDPSWKGAVRTAPWFRSLRADPRFVAAVGSATSP